jgi:tetratricopeptide (TPR) repeat protein
MDRARLPGRAAEALVARGLTATFCPRCRHENAPAAKFCIECGAPLARACTRCGTTLAAIPDEHQSTIYAPELERVRGELRRRGGEPEEAARCFQRAIAIARQRAERSLELRAAMSLAQLLADRGQRNEARAALDPVYRWFTEGFDTADLKAARALLDILA